MWLPSVSRQYEQIGNTNTSFNRCASPFSSIDYEQRFGPLNEIKPYKHLSIVLKNSLKSINEENSMKSFFLQRKNWFIALSLFFLLALLLAACGNNGSSNVSSKPTSTAGVATSPISTPSSTLTVQMGAQPCPDGVKNPAHWDPIIPTH